MGKFHDTEPTIPHAEFPYPLAGEIIDAPPPFEPGQDVSIEQR